MALLRTASPSDLGPVIESEHVMLRTPQMSAFPAGAELRAASREFLTPWEPLWASDELSRSSFRRRVRHYLRDLREDMGYALFIFAADSDDLVGGLTLCNVRRWPWPFASASSSPQWRRWRRSRRPSSSLSSTRLTSRRSANCMKSAATA